MQSIKRKDGEPRCWYGPEILCGPTTKVVGEKECTHCMGIGIEPGHLRANCKACGGTGINYDVWHDCSMFAGRDLRGVTREWHCPVHGIYGREGGLIRKCCDLRELRVVSQ